MYDHVCGLIPVELPGGFQLYLPAARNGDPEHGTMADHMSIIYIYVWNAFSAAPFSPEHLPS